MSETQPLDPPACTAWQHLVELFFAQHARHQTVIRSLGLNPPHAMALMQLDPDGPAPMRSLAGMLHCDASHVTGLVDRLEELGYVERRSDPADRRVKTLVLTPAGEEARAVTRAGLFEPPAQLLALSEADQTQLRDIIERAVRDSTSPDSAGPPDPPSATFTWRSDPLRGVRAT